MFLASIVLFLSFSGGPLQTSLAGIGNETPRGSSLPTELFHGSEFETDFTKFRKNGHGGRLAADFSFRLHHWRRRAGPSRGTRHIPFTGRHICPTRAMLFSSEPQQVHSVNSKLMERFEMCPRFPLPLVALRGYALRPDGGGHIRTFVLPTEARAWSQFKKALHCMQRCLEFALCQAIVLNPPGVRAMDVPSFRYNHRRLARAAGNQSSWEVCTLKSSTSGGFLVDADSSANSSTTLMWGFDRRVPFAPLWRASHYMSMVSGPPKEIVLGELDAGPNANDWNSGHDPRWPVVLAVHHPDGTSAVCEHGSSVTGELFAVLGEDSEETLDLVDAVMGDKSHLSLLWKGTAHCKGESVVTFPVATSPAAVLTAVKGSRGDGNRSVSGATTMFLHRFTLKSKRKKIVEPLLRVVRVSLLAPSGLLVLARDALPTPGACSGALTRQDDESLLCVPALNARLVAYPETVAPVYTSAGDLLHSFLKLSVECNGDKKSSECGEVVSGRIAFIESNGLARFTDIVVRRPRFAVNLLGLQLKVAFLCDDERPWSATVSINATSLVRPASPPRSPISTGVQPLYSLPVHECLSCVLQQLHNIRRFSPNGRVIVHVSRSMQHSLEWHRFMSTGQWPVEEGFNEHRDIDPYWVYFNTESAVPDDQGSPTAKGNSLLTGMDVFFAHILNLRMAVSAAMTPPSAAAMLSTNANRTKYGELVHGKISLSHWLWLPRPTASLTSKPRSLWEWSHAVFLASNELFVRDGVEAYLAKYDTVDMITEPTAKNGFLFEHHANSFHQCPKFNVYSFSSQEDAMLGDDGNPVRGRTEGIWPFYPKQLLWHDHWLREAMGNAHLWRMPNSFVFSEGTFFSPPLVDVLLHRTLWYDPATYVHDPVPYPLAEAMLPALMQDIRCYRDASPTGGLRLQPLKTGERLSFDYLHAAGAGGIEIHSEAALPAFRCGQRVTAVPWRRTGRHRGEKQWTVTEEDVKEVRCSVLSEGPFALKRFARNVSDAVRRYAMSTNVSMGC